jgi:hypothetical protein
MPGKPYNKWPNVWPHYGKPKHAPRASMRWSEPNLVAFIQSKPDWDCKKVAEYLNITDQHAKYLLLKANLPNIKAWLKDQTTAGQ